MEPQKMVIIIKDKGTSVGHWDNWAADMILERTEVPDTFKVIKSKYDPPGGFVRRIKE